MNRCAQICKKVTIIFFEKPKYKILTFEYKNDIIIDSKYFI